MELIKIMFNDVELSLDKEVLTQGIEKKEIIVKNDEVVLFKKPDYEVRLKNEKDSEYKKGRADGVEILVKEQKNKLGLEFEGKEPDLLLSKFKEKIEKDLNVVPDKRINELNTNIETLQKNLKAEIEKNTNLLKDFETKENHNKLNASLYAAIPEKAVTETLTKSDIVAMYRAAGYKNEIIDGKEVTTLNGEVVKNGTTLEPLTTSEVMKGFILAKKLIVNDGRGGGDDPNPAKPGTLEAFQKEMAEKGIKYGTDKFNQEMMDRIKNKTLLI